MIHLKKFLLSLPGFQALCRRLTRRHVRAFMYHRFRKDDDGGHALRASTLGKQLALVVAHHPVWTPDQQLQTYQDGAAIDSCPVVITADDGYWDYYRIAYPEFREHGIPAALFVTTGFVDGSVWMWWDKLEYLGEHAPPSVFELAIAGQTTRLDFSSPSERKLTTRYLINRCRFISEEDKNALLEDLPVRLGLEIPSQPPAAVSPVTWAQISEMRTGGLVFAPHSVTHPILTRVDIGRIDEEIAGSRDRLASLLGDAGRVFAYPQGGPEDSDSTVSQRVAAAGFRACYLAYQGPLLDNDPLQWPRYCPGECMTSFRWCLCGAEYLANRVRRFLGLSITPGKHYWYGSGRTG